MRYAALLILACLASGCTTRWGDLTVATPKNVPTQFQVVRKGISGKDCAYTFLFIPLGTLNPTLDGAIDDALAQVEGADAMTDVQMFNDIMYAVVFSSNCVRIEGTAIRTR